MVAEDKWYIQNWEQPLAVLLVHTFKEKKEKEKRKSSCFCYEIILNLSIIDNQKFTIDIWTCLQSIHKTSTILRTESYTQNKQTTGSNSN